MALLISIVDTIPKLKALLSPRTRTHSLNYNINESYHIQDANECKHLYWLENYNAKCEHTHEQAQEESDTSSPFTPSTPIIEEPFILLTTGSILSKYASTSKPTVDSIKKQIEQLNLQYAKFKQSVDATERRPLLTSPAPTPSLTMSTVTQRDRVLKLNLAYSQFTSRAREESQVPLKTTASS